MKEHSTKYRVSWLSLVLVLAWATGWPLMAQPSMKAGLRAGAMTSSFYGEDAGDVSYRSHIGGGLFVTYQFNEYLGVQPEVLFSAKGARVGGPAMGAAADVTYHISYLEVPVLARVFLPTSGAVQPSFLVGPALDIKLYGEADDRNLEGQVEGLDYSVVAGVNLSYAIGGYHLRQRELTLDVRYILGFNNVFDMAGNPDVRNQAFAFTLGFSL